MTPQSPSIRQTLWVTRILWAGMLAGEVILLIVIAYLQASGRSQPSAATAGLAPTLTLIAFGALALIPIGYFARMQIYKANWQDQAINPTGYLRGNAVLLAMCEAAALCGLVAVLLGGAWLPLVPAAIAMAGQVVNFPNGRAMLPDDPRFNEPGPGREPGPR